MRVKARIPSKITAVTVLLITGLVSGLCSPLFAQDSSGERKQQAFELTDEEQQWLIKHPTIRVHNESNWRPFNFYADGSPQGFSISFFNYLAEKTGFEVEYISGKNWGDYLEMIQEKELDVMLNIAITPEREEYILFTDRYITIAPALYSRKGLNPVSGVEDLFGKKFAIPKGFFMEEMLQGYEEIEIVSVSDSSEAILAVSSGQADFLFDLAPVVDYFSKIQLIDNLHPGGRMGIDAENPVDLRFGVRDDWVIFHSILQKGLNSITGRELNDLRKEWMNVSAGIELALTDEERTFLDSHPNLRVHNEADWPPFNYYENNKPQGFSIDYMNLLAELLEVQIEYYSGPSWNSFLEMIKNKELDVMLNIVKTNDRQEYILFTDSYIRNPNVIVSSSANPFNTIEELFGKTVAIPEGFFYEEVLRENYPQIKRLPLQDLLECLKAVSFGDADAVLGEEAVIRNLIARNMLTGIKISGEADIGNPDYQNLRIGVRDDFPLLRSALMKAMAAVTPQQMQVLQQKWILQTPYQDTRGESEDAGEKSWFGGIRIYIYIIAVFVLLSFIFWVIIRATRGKGLTINYGSKQFKLLTLAGQSIIIIIIVVQGFLLLGHNRIETINATEESLIITLENAEARLNLWIKQRTSYLERLGRDPELSNLVSSLLTVDPDKDSLISSSELEDVREFFNEHQDELLHIGFSVINPDYISVGSRRDTKIGIPNLIAKTYPDLIERAFLGRVMFVPSLESDVTLSEVTGNEGKLNPSTMFLLGPIRQVDGTVIAVMTLRVNPSDEFSQALQFSTIRSTSDTYAISCSGLMLSDSRFLDDLQKIGLTKENQHSAMNMKVYNPGVKLEIGQQLPHWKELPLTQMATTVSELSTAQDISNEIHKHSSFKTNMEGYLDYRGIPVFGSGIWSYELGLGLITEIDVDEALGPFYSLRVTVFILLGVTITISVAAILFVLTLGEHANLALIKSRNELEDQVNERTAELNEKQELLREEEEKSRLLIESVGEGIFGLNTSGQISFVNPAAEKLLGYNRNELIGNDVHSLIHHSYADGSSYPGEECPMRAAFKDGKSHFITDEVLWCKNGASIFVNYTSTPILKQDKLIGSVVIFSDVSDQKKAEMEIKKLSKTVEQSPISIVITDPNGAIEYVNPKFEEVTGYSKEEAIGKNPRILNSGILPKKFYSNMWKTILLGNEWHGEFANKKKSGEVFWESASISSMKDENGIITHFVALKEDITARKNADEELREAKETAETATKAKSDFLANMSHEIRTPMNAIIGLDSLLAKTQLNPKQQDYVEKIGSSAKNLLGIINDILDFSKIEAGKLEIEETTFVLNEVLDNLSGMIGEKARDKGLELIFIQDMDVPQYLVGDPLRIGQILLNLTNNSIKFTEKGEIVVISKLISMEEQGVLIRFEVSDTGIGLTEEQVGKLFKSFSQADTSTTRKFGGSGLGLSISKKLSKMMGGEIGVMSEYGKGSTFNFTIQLGIGEGKAKKKQATPENLIGLKVLVVDDNETASDVLTSYLNDFSFQTKAVSSGELALRELIQAKAAKDKEYDLVLMDYQMPGMNGIETSRKIREELENREVPKIVMVTGFGREEIMRQAEKVGLQGFLIKPVSPSMLYDTIMEVFGKSSGIVEQYRAREEKPEGFENIRGAKLLLVEDNEINRQVAKETLEQEGFYIDVAEDGKVAVEKIHTNDSYDLILMDLQMPVMDGYEATIEIRKDECYKELPIVAMTADAMTGVREQVEKIGMSDYITKPIVPKDLWRALTKWIKPGDRKLPEGFKKPGNKADGQIAGMTVIPSVDGLNMEEGLSHVSGNKKLYLSLLTKFRDGYGGTVTEIKEAVEKGEREAAVRLAHTVKGVAGNIGAGSVQEAAAVVEKALKDEEENEEILSRLEEILSMLIENLNQVDLDVERPAEDESQKDEIDPDELRALLSELEPILEKRKPKPAKEIIEKLNSYALPEELEFDFKQLSGFIGKYKFKDAMEVLKKIH